MDRSRFRQLQPLTRVLLVVAVASSLVTACDAGAQAMGVQSAAVVSLDDDVTAAAKLTDVNTVSVLVRRPSGLGAYATSSITSHRFSRPGNGVSLLTYGGDTNEAWNTFVYGSAMPGVAKVQLDWPDSRGGQVVDGAWLIVLRDRDVHPDQLHWQFLQADGTVSASGTGPFPPDA
jgi:hypothetical protein